MNQTEKDKLSDKKLLELILASQCKLIKLIVNLSSEKCITLMVEESRRQAEFKRELLKRAARRRRLESQVAQAKDQACVIGRAIHAAFTCVPELHEILNPIKK